MSLGARLTVEKPPQGSIRGSQDVCDGNNGLPSVGDDSLPKLQEVIVLDAHSVYRNTKLPSRPSL